MLSWQWCISRFKVQDYAEQRWEFITKYSVKLTGAEQKWVRYNLCIHSEETNKYMHLIRANLCFQVFEMSQYLGKNKQKGNRDAVRMNKVKKFYYWRCFRAKFSVEAKGCNRLTLIQHWWKENRVCSHMGKRTQLKHKWATGQNKKTTKNVLKKKNSSTVFYKKNFERRIKITKPEPELRITQSPKHINLKPNAVTLNHKKINSGEKMGKIPINKKCMAHV